MLGRRYRLGKELGRGASGAVYRGRDLQNGRLVAIKVLSAGAPEPPARERKYVVMEYAPGRDLRHHIHSGRLLALPTVLSIGARVAESLAQVHRRGAVHGDVSPSNIVFDAASEAVKLVDFAAAGPGASARGTPAYMSPEQVCGLAIGPASDQFSLGAVLYRLFCGRLPFRASSRPQLAHSIVHERHADVRSHEPTLPAELAALLDRMLAKKPRARFASAAAAARALRKVARSHGVRAAPAQ